MTSLFNYTVVSLLVCVVTTSLTSRYAANYRLHPTKLNFYLLIFFLMIKGAVGRRKRRAAAGWSWTTASSWTRRSADAVSAPGTRPSSISPSRCTRWTSTCTPSPASPPWLWSQVLDPADHIHPDLTQNPCFKTSFSKIMFVYDVLIEVNLMSQTFIYLFIYQLIILLNWWSRHHSSKSSSKKKVESGTRTYAVPKIHLYLFTNL